MNKGIFKGIVLFSLSFSIHSAVSVIGPDGRVELFYQDGEKIVAKECNDHGTLMSVEDCEIAPGKRVREYSSIDEFVKILGAGLRNTENDWDGEMEESIIFYNKRLDENIKRLVIREAYLVEEIARREKFSQEYGSGAIDVKELEDLKNELSTIQGELGDFEKTGIEKIRQVERKIEEIAGFIKDSDDSLHYFIFPKDEETFVYKALKAFWNVGSVSNFKEIQPGKFLMGSPSDEEGRLNDEEGVSGEQVEVQINRPYEMMTTEVTQRQWFEVMGYNPSLHNQPIHCDNHEVVRGINLCPDNPVEGISWTEIQGFAVKLNQSEKLEGCDGSPSSAKGCYRLPTEAEWEYAARGGATTAYSFGDDAEELIRYGWHGRNSGRQTRKVAQLEANPFGLYDMHGNVWEWVQDGYVEKLPGGADPYSPQIENGVFHVVRGGSWFHISQDLRSAFRKGVYTDNRYNNIGFRLVRTR